MVPRGVRVVHLKEAVGVHVTGMQVKDQQWHLDLAVVGMRSFVCLDRKEAEGANSIEFEGCSYGDPFPTAPQAIFSRVSWRNMVTFTAINDRGFFFFL